VRASAAQVEALIAREVSRGIPDERIVLAGFSQGGAMALFAGLRHPRPLGGIMVLSGYEVVSRARAEVAAANSDTPLLFCHGTHDPMVDVSRARDAFAVYRQGRPDAQWHEFPMGHEVSPAEIAVIRDWLGSRFAAAR
jgi:phospholipase/carboxylesterase